MVKEGLENKVKQATLGMQRQCYNKRKWQFRNISRLSPNLQKRI
jgi:hypothetical protein